MVIMRQLCTLWLKIELRMKDEYQIKTNQVRKTIREWKYQIAYQELQKNVFCGQMSFVCCMDLICQISFLKTN